MSEPTTTDIAGTAEGAGSVDPVLLAVIANRFDAIVREMTNTLLRAGRSAVINMARDFSCSIVTADTSCSPRRRACRCTCSAPACRRASMRELHPRPARGRRVPAQRPLRRQHPRRRPHDPGAGLRRGRAPVHRLREGPPGRLRQLVPTTYMPYARDVYEEGALIFPCVRIQRDYEDIDDIVRMCRRRIRVPDQWYGDYLATLGAARIGERRLKELVDEVRARDGPRLRRASGSTTPSGAWCDGDPRAAGGAADGARHHDPCPALPDGSPVNVEVASTPTRGGSRSTCATTSTASTAASTCRACTAISAMIGVFNCLDPDLPHNAGSFRRIGVLLREGARRRDRASRTRPRWRRRTSRPALNPSRRPSPSSATATGWPRAAARSARLRGHLGHATPRARRRTSTS